MRLRFAAIFAYNPGRPPAANISSSRRAFLKTSRWTRIAFSNASGESIYASRPSCNKSSNPSLARRSFCNCENDFRKSGRSASSSIARRVSIRSCSDFILRPISIISSSNSFADLPLPIGPPAIAANTPTSGPNIELNPGVLLNRTDKLDSSIGPDISRVSCIVNVSLFVLSNARSNIGRLSIISSPRTISPVPRNKDIKPPELPPTSSS